MRDYVAYSIVQVGEGRIDVDRHDISAFRHQLRLTSFPPKTDGYSYGAQAADAKLRQVDH